MGKRRFTRQEFAMAMSILNETWAKSEAMEDLEAKHYVVVTFDTETERIDVYGPYDSPVDAMADGEFHNIDINRHETEPQPIEFTVMPLRGRIR